MTPNQYLENLISNYVTSASTFEAMRKHRAGIESRLDSWLGVNQMFEIGSLRHGTGVRYYTDADYLVSLKGERPTATTALNKVREALKDRYPTTTVRVSRPAVKCEFANGDETVEVVPAYWATDSAGGYWIPNPVSSDGGWMRAFPSDHNAYVNEVNKKHSGGAKKLTRLAKIWKYERNVPISSCYLEMRAAAYADGETTWNLTYDVARFLTHLSAVDLRNMNDPTGKSSRFSACASDATKADAISKLDTAITRATKATASKTADNDAAAIDWLKLLFNQ